MCRKGKPVVQGCQSRRRILKSAAYEKTAARGKQRRAHRQHVPHFDAQRSPAQARKKSPLNTLLFAYNTGKDATTKAAQSALHGCMSVCLQPRRTHMIARKRMINAPVEAARSSEMTLIQSILASLVPLSLVCSLRPLVGQCRCKAIDRLEAPEPWARQLWTASRLKTRQCGQEASLAAAEQTSAWCL